NPVVVSCGLGYTLTLAGAWRWVEEGLCELRGWTQSHNAEMLTLTLPEGDVQCIGLENYVQAPLHELAAQLGTGFTRLDPATLSDQDALDYAALGALTVAECCDNLLRWLAKYAPGCWRPTAAGMAWDSFRSRLWGSKIRIHNHGETTRLERCA